MTYAAKMILDSVSPNGVRLTTIEVTFPRIVLAEFNTHRVLSRNSASSRAIPIPKRIEMVRDNPYVPDEFGSNQKGMQSGEALQGPGAYLAASEWLRAAENAVRHAAVLAEAGVHKEYANRLLEPFCWHTVIVTATEWDNFWGLRCNPNATRPIRLAAELMREAYDKSLPAPVNYGDWHLPYLQPGESFDFDVQDGRPPFPPVATKVRVSVARCARVSYMTHDGKRDPGLDLELYDRLRAPGHMSPLEHVARPAQPGDRGRADVMVGEVTEPYNPEGVWFGNFKGWVQHRKLVLGEDVFRG